MARPKKVKEEEVEVPAKQDHARYCKECNGILFSGQILHQNGCSRKETK